MDPFNLDEWPEKSLWRERSAEVFSFYCPLCKCPRKIPYRPRPGGPRQIAQIALTTAFLMLLAWPWFGWKGVVVGLPLWMGFEVYYRTRVRAALSCPHCGFDPVLYMVDARRARVEVEAHWRKVFADKGIPFPEKPGKKSVVGATANAKRATPGESQTPGKTSENSAPSV